MPRDLPPYRFELRYPFDDLDEGEDNGPDEFGAPPGSYEVLRAQTTEEARFEAARLWKAATPPTRLVMLSGAAIGGASIPTGSVARRRQTDIGRR
jgi:hypothetical protein